MSIFFFVLGMLVLLYTLLSVAAISVKPFATLHWNKVFVVLGFSGVFFLLAHIT